MTLILPTPRKIPIVPRPRHGELSASYLARVARANRTDLRTFVSLLGSLPSGLSSESPDLAIMVLTLNDAAFTRLLTYTGLDGDQLIRAVPSLAPQTFSSPGEPPAIRLSFTKTPAADCPGCRMRRDGAHADTRLFSHKAACLRHGFWLYGRGSGQRLDLAKFPEVAAAQGRLDRIASRRGPTAAMRAYEIASGYLQQSWRTRYHPYWYPALLDRWQQRVRTTGALTARITWQLPAWAVHPECAALAATFASPYWAALSVPTPDRRHGLFYQRLLAELSLDNGTRLRTMRIFDPLPNDIQEQARWGRLLNDPDWGAPPPAAATSKTIPFIDITDDYEKSIRKSPGWTWLESAFMGVSPTRHRTLHPLRDLSCGAPWPTLLFLAMGLIDFRRFDVATCFGDRGELEFVDIQLADKGIWDINLAELVKANGLAVPADRQLTYRVMQHELRLLLSFLVDEPGSPLSLRHADFRASSGHVKRFVSESLGLGMLTAAAERHHRWKLTTDDLHNFDVLPAGIATQYPGSGIRPDLLFHFTGEGQDKRLAGEARGRSSARPVMQLTSQDQRNRLADIVAWSGVNDLHPVTMTYAYTGAANAQVDLFDIAAPDYLKTAADIMMIDREGLVTQAGRRFERLSYIEQRARGRAAEIANQLYETAPQGTPGLRQSVYGRDVRGSWARADLIAPSNLRFFFGLLDRPLTPEEAGAPRRRRNAAGQADADPIQVAATGRILVAVARDATQDPDWSEITSRVE